MRRASLRIWLIMAAAAAFASCTRNNGDIGFWFGQWKVTSVQEDGAEASYDGTIYFCFQSSVVEQKVVYGDHSVDQAYGHWTENEAESTITLYFDDDAYKPVDGLMSAGANVMSYTHSGSSLTLSLIDDDRTLVYSLTKW